MRYLIIAILSAACLGLIFLNEYYNDSPEGAHYLEFPIGVPFFYFGLIYVLLLGIFELIRLIYRVVRKGVSMLKKHTQS